MDDSSTQPSPEEARKAAAAVLAPDPDTADLLAKHAAGVKLDAKGYGKIGAWTRFKNAVGLGDKAGQPNPARPGESSPMASVSSAQAPSDGLPDTEPDANVCQRTTGIVLTRVEKLVQRKLSNAARQADPEAKTETLARIARSGALSADDKALLIELSPDVARELGVNPRRYPLWIFFGVLGFYGAEMWLAIDELKQERKTREERRQPTPVPAGTAVLVQQQTYERPLNPPGAQPEITAKLGGSLPL